MWNTIIRGDHQINANNTYSVRWLRETSPQTNQIVPTATQAVTARAAREESDVDQTLATNLNTVLSNTNVNTLRLTWTRENVAFANALLQRQRPRPLQVRADAVVPGLHRSAGQHRRSRASTTRIQLDDTMAWFIPASTATTTSRSAAQYEVLGRGERQPGRPERHVRVRPERCGRSTRPIPGTYPDRFTIRVGGPEQLLREGALRRRVRAGQVAVQPAADAEPRRALRRRDHSDRRDATTRWSTSYPVDKNNFQPRVGVTYDLGGGHEHRPRRLRPLLRQDALRADRRPLHRHAVHRPRSL